MEDNRYEDLQRDVNYLNEEGFVPEGKQLHVFRNADELIEAIRNNQVPGIEWSEEDEAKWQAAEAIDNALGEEHSLNTNEGDIEEMESMHTEDEDEDEDWTVEDIWDEIPESAKELFRVTGNAPAFAFEDEAFLGPEDALHLAADREEELMQQMKERNHKSIPSYERETIDWTDPSISQEEIDFQWEELFKED